MPAEPIRQNGANLDLSSRFAFTTAIVGSPALAAETIIASLTLSANIQAVTGVDLTGWAAYTVGTSGTAVQFRLRQTNVAGSVVGNTGTLTGSQHGAAILSTDDCEGFDTAPTLPGQIYVLTMQVTAGAAISTVSAVKLRAIIV
jgi:hypothetical protein